MGIWTYYSPFGIGLVITLVLHETVRAHAPALPGWAEWPFVVGVGVVVGLTGKFRLRPKMIVLLDKNKRFHRDYRTIDLSSPEQADLSVTRGLPPEAYGIDLVSLFS